MANQKRTVSLDDYLACYHYFYRAIQNDRFMIGNQDNGLKAKAIHGFYELESLNPNEKDVSKFQSWIDNFVDPKTWGRCYRAINQKKYLVNNNSRTITINDEAYSALKTIAHQNDIGLSQAIIYLSKLEPTKLNTKPLSLDPIELKFPMVKTINQPQKSSFDAVKPNLAEKKGAEIIPLFKDESLDPIDEPFDFTFDPDHLDHEPEWPRKPEGYDFRKNESYKKYRNYIQNLTVKKQDEGLLQYFSNVMNYQLTKNNCQHVGQQLLSIRQELLHNNLVFKEFNSECFAISKGFTVSDLSIEGYTEELLYFLSLIFGCTFWSITSGNREPVVFAGHPNHVQIAYEIYRHLSIFLSEEVRTFRENCHKNTKRKNRNKKAKWHGQDLVGTMLNPILDDDEQYKLLSDKEHEKLSQYVYKKVYCYYDENEPIGGWWDPKKHPYK